VVQPPDNAKTPDVRALKGRKKGTRGVEVNIAGEQSHASRAPAGALVTWGGSLPVVPGRSATFTTV
jgi:hypothetical protein